MSEGRCLGLRQLSHAWIGRIDFGNTVYRAKIAARILEIAQRTDVPVGIGIKTADSVGAQSPWVKDYDLSKYPGKVYQDQTARFGQQT